jgi:hypothetical protein
MSAVTSVEAFAADSGVFALMNTAWGWPIAESIHFIGLSLLLGSVGVVDARLLGLAQRISISDLHAITRWGVVGFGLNVVTGTAFFVSAPDQYLYNPAFQLKVACMLLAIANVAAFYGLVWPRVRASSEVPIAAKACAAISLSAWIGVIAFGRLITFYRPPEHWCFWCV